MKKFVPLTIGGLLIASGWLHVGMAVLGFVLGWSLYGRVYP